MLFLNNAVTVPCHHIIQDNIRLLKNPVLNAFITQKYGSTAPFNKNIVVTVTRKSEI